MTLHLADTSAWNRSGSVADRWQELLGANELALAAPIRLELLYSARAREYDRLARDYALLPDLPLDDRVSQLAERAQAVLGQTSRHRGPRPIDVLIAALAERHGAKLLHYDRHFDLIAEVTGQEAEWIAPPGSID